MVKINEFCIVILGQCQYDHVESENHDPVTLGSILKIIPDNLSRITPVLWAFSNILNWNNLDFHYVIELLAVFFRVSIRVQSSPPV